MTKPSIARGNHGFTLVELLAVIVIASILIVTAMQGIKVIGSTALQTAARQFSNDLQMARQYAITKRVRVRVLLAVDSGSNIPGGFDTNNFYRAYCVYALTTPNATRLTDWRVLPQGVVFTDQETYGTDYSPIQLTTVGCPTGGVHQCWNVNSQGAIPGSLVKSTFDCGTNVTDNGVMVTGSGIDFLPSGRANNYYTTATGSHAGGVRLASGSVVANPLNPGELDFIIPNTNNWVYIEYDFMGGRIRTRWSDTYE